MPATPNQKLAIETSGRPLFIQAGAGTGKTFTLTKRLGYGLSEESGKVISGVDNLLTITYTEKAAAELLGRVRAELRARGLAQEALEVDVAWISTIHSMCRRMLMAHSFEVGIDPGAGLLSEEDSSDLLAKAIEDVLACEQDYPQLQLLLDHCKIDDCFLLLSKLAATLELAPQGVETFELPLAPACSAYALATSALEQFASCAAQLDALDVPQGKTYQTNLSRVMALSHDFAAWLYEQDASLSWAALCACLDAYAMPTAHKLKEPFMGLFAQCRGAYLDMATQAQAANLRELLQAALEIAQVVAQKHAASKHALGMLDTNDLLIECYRLLKDNPRIAAQYRSQFASIMIDEFQDTDTLQVELVRLLCDDALSTLATVGDAQQSIYGFRGADLEVYREMRASMAACGSQEVKLDMNFRSHPGILGFVEDIFSKPEFFGGEFLRVVPGPANARELSWAAADEPRVQVILSAGEQAPEGANKYTSLKALRAQDAQSVADAFERLHEKGAAYGDMAILLQSVKGTHSRPFIEALRERGIPCVIAGGSDFYLLPEVKTLASLLRMLQNRDDDVALFEVLASPMFDIDDDALLELSVVCKQQLCAGPEEARGKASLFDALRVCAKGSSAVQHEANALLKRAYQVLSDALGLVGHVPLSQVVMSLLHTCGWYEALQAKGVTGSACWANIQRFVDLLFDYEQTYGRSAFRCAEHFSRMCTLAQDGMGARGKPGAMISSGKEAVEIMTIHSSKGLERPIVAVAEFERSGGSAGVAAQMLTENGRSYLSLPVEGSGPVAGYFKETASDPESFARASSPCAYLVHACRLFSQRAAQEEQRLLYVALTRARDMLFLVGHDKAYATKGELGQGMLRDVLEAAFDGNMPKNGTTTRLSSGALVTFSCNRVPYEAAANAPYAGVEDGAEEQQSSAQEHASIVHFTGRVRAASHISSQVSRGQDIYSYSTISSHGTQAGGLYDAPQAVCLKDRSTQEETVSPLGSAFHLVAQWIANTRSIESNALDARVAAAAVRYELDSQLELRLRQAVRTWAAAPRLREAFSYPRLYAEHAFCVQVGQVPLEGYIDLLCVDSQRGSALVIDYKTGDSGTGDELRERYELQAFCYAYAVLSTQCCEHVELAFVRPEVDLEEVCFTFERQDLPQLAEKILA